ncbi:MAG TPA: DUF5654 family protein [Candidatus Saccharimonadales bacterium]|nr:DUF5654 family protein [Candidatus Saccharimonadales bacterium]
MTKKTQKKEHKKKIHVAVLEQMVLLSTSGFGLVAALAWNNVIQEVVNNYIKKFLPSGSGIISLLLYAIAITILAVLVTTQLTRILERVDQE